MKNNTTPQDNSLQNCIEDIKIWMTFNMLTLDGNKTEFIMFGTKQQLAKISHIEVRNLGYFMYCLLKNTYHVNKICTQLYSNLWDLRSIRTHNDIETAKIIIQAIILSKLDYCNSYLPRTSEQQIRRLQQNQNMACQIIYNIRKCDHIIDKMEGCHWLKIS